MNRHHTKFQSLGWSVRPARLRWRRAFTLVEMIVVIVIIAVLATLIGPRLFGRIGQSKATAAASNAKAIASAIKLYAADYGSLPSSIDALATKSTDAKGFGPYVENADQLKDPWGNKFILRVPPQKNADFDILSYGADQKPGGEGEDADIVMP